MSRETEKHIEVIERMMFAMPTHKVDGIRIFPTLKEAKNALEKQIQSKPVYNCTRRALCPICDGELYPKFLYVRRFKHEEIRIEEKTPYCKHCGHALDWGKEIEVAERRKGVENSPVDCSTLSVTDQKGEGK